MYFMFAAIFLLNKKAMAALLHQLYMYCASVKGFCVSVNYINCCCAVVLHQQVF